MGGVLSTPTIHIGKHTPWQHERTRRRIRLEFRIIRVTADGAFQHHALSIVKLLVRPRAGPSAERTRGLAAADTGAARYRRRPTYGGPNRRALALRWPIVYRSEPWHDRH
jgi:hypothetical protein